MSEDRRPDRVTLDDGLYKYLLAHESDIALGINDFDALVVAFVAATGRVPVSPF